MPFIVKAPPEKYATAPAGTFPAVCVDLIDLGMVENRFDPEADAKATVRLVWQLDEDDPDTGNPYLVRHDYTASLHEKAALRKTLGAWRGRDFTPAELFGFDLETILGVGCLISVVHNQGKKGGTFANVSGVMKLPKNMKAPEIRNYTRMKDRQPEPEPVRKPPTENNFEISDEDIPF